MSTWEEPPLTARQQRRIHAQLTGLGVKLRGDRLTILCQITGRTVLSTKDLTMVEADQVTDGLTRFGNDAAAVRDAYLATAAVEEATA